MRGISLAWGHGRSSVVRLFSVSGFLFHQSSMNSLLMNRQFQSESSRMSFVLGKNDGSGFCDGDAEGSYGGA